MQMFDSKPLLFYSRRSFIYVFCFFLFSILAALAFWYAEPIREWLGFWEEDVEVNENSGDSDEPKIVYDYYPKPRMADETLAPWNWADDELETSPEMPDEQLLIELYRNVREAVVEKDYQKYTANIASEIVWHSQNNKHFVGTTEDGYSVFEVDENTGEENFINNPNKLSTKPLPDLNLVEFSSYELVEEEPIEDLGTIIVIFDPDRNEGTYVDATDWRYKVIANVNCGDSCDYSVGSVFYVYDNGEWKYYRENWKRI